jgi:hypothetical protein
MSSLTRAEKWFYAFALATVFLAGANAFKDSDSFYHLKAGQVIWETKSIPRTDVFSSSAPGGKWVTHEWLAELLFYGVYHVGGFNGVIVAVALLAVLTYFLVIQTAMNRGAKLAVAAVIALVIGYLPFDLWVPRPQIFSFLTFALLLFSLESYRRTKQLRWLYLSVAVMWFWANTNASVLLGLVVMLFYAVSEFLKSKKDGSRLSLAFLGALAASLANPNTYHILFYRNDIQEGIRLLRILEWYPITYFIGQNGTKLFLAEMILPVILLLWYFGFQKKHRDLTSLGVVIGIAILPFISFRLVGFWPLAVTPFLAPVFSQAKQRFIAVGFGVIAVVFVMRVNRIPTSYYNRLTVPVQAVDFIEQTGLKGPFFNLYNEGGYLLWRLWPREHVFVDARAEVYEGRPFNELFAIASNSPEADRLINDTYQFNYMILAYRPESLAQWIFPLVKRLSNEGWPLVYWDDTVVVFVRPVPGNQDIIAKYALWHVNPFRPPESIPAAEARPAKNEIDALLKRVPDSQAVQFYLRQFEASHAQIRP